MFDRKPVAYKSPDVTKLQEVIIDMKTRIYIAMDDDPKQAKKRYLERLHARSKF